MSRNVSASLCTPNNSSRAFSDRKAHTLFRLQLVSSVCTTNELASSTPEHRQIPFANAATTAGATHRPVICVASRFWEKIDHETDFVKGQAADIDQIRQE